MRRPIAPATAAESQNDEGDGGGPYSPMGRDPTGSRLIRRPSRLKLPDFGRSGRRARIYRLDPSPTGSCPYRTPFDLIENPICKQFHTIVHEEPSDGIAPNEQ